MRMPKLLAVLTAVALSGAPTLSAFAQPAPVTRSIPAPAPSVASSGVLSSSVDAVRYAVREGRSKAIAEFKGGGDLVIIGGSTLAIILIVVLVVVLL